MKIRIEKNIDTEEPVNDIIDDFRTLCREEAKNLLYDAGLVNDEVADNVQKVADELWENVLTKLAFEYNKEG